MAIVSRFINDSALMGTFTPLFTWILNTASFTLAAEMGVLSFSAGLNFLLDARNRLNILIIGLSLSIISNSSMTLL